MITISSIEHLERLQHNQCMKGHRTLCLVGADHTLAAQWAQTITHPIPPNQRIKWPSTQPYNLGVSALAVTFDAFQGFHPDHFCALLDMLQGGGLFFLLVPPSLAAWEAFVDPEHQKMAPHANQTPRNRFVAYLINTLRPSETPINNLGIYWIDTNRVIPTAFNWKYPGPKPDVLLPTQAQSNIVHAVTAHATQTQAYTCLLADRGRGKSTGIAIALAKQIKKTNTCNYMLCTPKYDQGKQIIDQVSKQLGNKLEPPTLTWQSIDTLNTNSTIPSSALLIVDEAAGFPIYQLNKLLNRFSNILFSTTVIGYEGSGQGFVTHFKQTLKNRTRHYTEINLTEPLRWQPNDPIETWLNQTFFFKDVTRAQTQQHQHAPIKLIKLDLDTCYKTPNTLNQVISLLRTAHYRTRPSDLRLLLDAPGQHLFSAWMNDTLVGVAWVCQDGPLPEHLHTPIFEGKRRPPGHLLPQYLCKQTQDIHLLSQTIARVIRIAVVPHARRQQVGTRLIKAIEQFSKDQGWEAVGAQFSNQHSTNQFWQAQGWEAVAQGQKHQASTGETSLTYLKQL